MYSKSERQNIIRNLISSRQIRSQEQLQDLLKEAGLKVTQATLSRDFSDLGVVKVRDASCGCRYALHTPSSHVGTAHPADSSPLSAGDFSIRGVRSIEFSSAPFAVIKTSPGFAGALASILDTAEHSELMGTLAGDDTILLILRDGVSRDSLMNSLDKVLPGIRSRLVSK